MHSSFDSEEDMVPIVDTGSKASETQVVISRRIEILIKIAATLIVICAGLYHLVRILKSGSDTCPLLFKSGRWTSSDDWQPFGCTMHSYFPSETRTCLRNNKVAFIGDSRIRGLYYTLIGSLNAQQPPTTKYHGNLQYSEPSNISVQFYWLPEVDEKMVKQVKSWIEHPAEAPDLIIAGAATWTIKNHNIVGVLEYQEHLSSLKKTIDDLMDMKREKKGLVKTKRRIALAPQAVWVLQDPVVETKLKQSRQSITNEKIELFNMAAAKVLSGSSFEILTSASMAAAERPSSTLDGLHYLSDVTDKQVDIILNSFCNTYMGPEDASCCAGPEKITRLQYNTFAILATCCLLWMIMFAVRKWRTKQGHDKDDLPPELQEGCVGWIYSDEVYQVMKSLAKLAMIMLYFFICDRTDLFMKENSRFEMINFLVPLGTLLILGLATKKMATEAAVLNNEQVMEWQGWMVTVLLLYNYTEAHKVLPIYVNTRLVAASFLFLVGFRNFSYFWKRGDFGLYRVCKIMAKINVVSVALCLVMGRPYQFYYIIPLISFWFLIVYFVMVTVPRTAEKIVKDNAKRYLWIIMKFGVLFGVIFVVWGNETVCEWVFSQWAVKELFVDVSGTTHDWRFRSGLDRYSVLYGMVFALCYEAARRYNILNEGREKKFLFPPLLSGLGLLIGLSCVVGYQVQAFTCHSEILCNFTHAVASSIPITGFVLLRNIPTCLRARFSGLFAWIGEMSLELFVAQYHIWLARDAHGVLVFIPNQPEINGVLCTFVFGCVVHELAKISTTLSHALVTKDVRVMLRRLVIFTMALVIIWWHKTHEMKPVPS